METVRYEFDLYDYEELSSEAQSKALNDYAKFAREECALLIDLVSSGFTRLTRIFNVRFEGWKLDFFGNIENRGYVVAVGDIWHNSHYSDPAELRGLRLRTFIINNFYDEITQYKKYSNKDFRRKRISKIICIRKCVLSGLNSDNKILEPLYNFIDGIGDMDKDIFDLLGDCLMEGLKYMTSEIQYTMSEESLIKLSNTNEWKYLKDGTIFSTPQGGVRVKCI